MRLRPGTPARLRTAMVAFLTMPAHPDSSVELPCGATCMVLQSKLNSDQGPLYMTQALFGARALWVPATSLEPKG